MKSRFFYMDPLDIQFFTRGVPLDLAERSKCLSVVRKFPKYNFKFVIP